MGHDMGHDGGSTTVRTAHRGRLRAQSQLRQLARAALLASALLAALACGAGALGASDTAEGDKDAVLRGMLPHGGQVAGRRLPI